MASQRLNFLNDTADIVAARLLGCTIERDIDGMTLRGRIVETEAYDETDAASHSYNGRTPRTEVMFGSAGHLYVYFTYGMHYCCNVVVGRTGYGAAVLIRAIEPIDGIEKMQHLRGKSGVDMTNGPAKLCQAFAIKKSENGTDLRTGIIRLIVDNPIPVNLVTTTTRIGISREKDRAWRFYITDNPYVSNKL
ncbi:DNA-3-methyladenine glycosylase [bacterium]|nr:MAG: DNA-3-methyladenine glycosylase [bacterium]